MNKSLVFNCKDINQFMKAKKVSKFSIAGHSLGGYIGGHYMDSFPEDVDQLYLLSPGGMNFYKEEYQEDIQKKMQNMRWIKRFLVKYHLEKIFEKKVKVSLFLKTRIRPSIPFISNYLKTRS